MTKNAFKKSNKVAGFVNLIVINFLLAFLITIVAGFVMGYKCFNIITGSMTPTMPVGTIVIVKNVDIASVEVGDVVTFTQGDSKVTHRVVEKVVNRGNVMLYTQGDAAQNQGSRETVTKQNYVGVVVFHVKYLGYLFEIIRDNIIYIVVAAVLAMFIITYS